MPIVQPKLSRQSLGDAVSTAFTRSGQSAPTVVGGNIPSGGGLVNAYLWNYNSHHFAPHPWQFQVGSFAGRLDKVERLFLSEVDATDIDRGGTLLSIADGQDVDIGGIAVGVVHDQSFWQWPKTSPWRKSNVYHTLTFVEPIDLSDLQDQTPYTIGFI